MVIIVEGMDRCGKSTIIKKIRKYFVYHNWNQLTFLKGTGNKEQDLQTNIDAINLVKTALYNDIDLILDRSWYSEIVYSSIYRGYLQDILLVKERELLYAFSHQIYLIMLIDRKKNLIKREDGESITNIDHARLYVREHQKFQSVIKNCVIPEKNILVIDESKLFSLECVWHSVKSFLKRGVVDELDKQFVN